VSTIDAATNVATLNMTRHGVTLLAWPAEEPTRRVLAARRIPRVLLIAADCAPPDITDSLEDWMRDPIDSVDLEARARALALRSAASSPPDRSSWVIDDHDIARLIQDVVTDVACPTAPSIDVDSGVLRFANQWIVISARQLPIATLLVERFGSVVSRSEVAAAYASADGSTDRAAFKSVMLRLGQRLAQVDLTLRAVRGRGYVLEHDTRTLAC
jgi:DNA-binding response OmpR family regulator